MGHHKLRRDKTCLNCRAVVDKNYCSNCGQENSDSRKTFHHLFIHFFEDLTHYENAFWKTIKNLLFKPGALTKEYLSGRRMSYLAPVRLYIFISFATFLLMGILPSYEADGQETDQIDFTRDGKKTKLHFGSLRDSLASSAKGPVRMEHSGDFDFGKYKSESVYDSIQQTLPPAQRDTGFKKWFSRKMAHTSEQTTEEGFLEKLAEGFTHNLPKALFLYMPLFAFFLWLFHDKVRWYYFDHGIFTLHYFSFMLVTFSVYLILNSILSYTYLSALSNILSFAMLLWWFFYFFRSHSNFYGERKLISRLKGLALFCINVFLLTIFITALFLYTLIYLH